MNLKCLNDKFETWLDQTKDAVINPSSQNHLKILLIIWAEYSELALDAQIFHMILISYRMVKQMKIIIIEFKKLKIYSFSAL